jgi:ABC-2 type transport system ATP-binding protein
MIEAEGLTKRYGGKVAVNGLTFTVRPGVVTGFLGPNGAGKSTTMRMILGLDRPSAGSVTVNGRPYAAHPAPLREVGALLEATAFQAGRTALDHLRALAASNGLPRGRAAEVVEQVGLGDAAHRRARGFSLGMAQRLGIAAMLLGDPRTLILDEPLNGLDPEGIVWIRTLLKDLAAEERTVFVSSHLLSEMALTAEHLIVISRGTLVADTSVAEFLQRASPARVRVRTPQAAEFGELLAGPAVTIVNLPDGLLDVSGMTSDQIGQAASRHFITLLELTVHHPSLEEAFMELTKESTGDPHRPHSAAADAPARATPDGARRPR